MDHTHDAIASYRAKSKQVAIFTRKVPASHPAAIYRKSPQSPRKVPARVPAAIYKK